MSRRDPSLRFDSRVNKTNGCWLWTGHLTHGGYGCIRRIGGRTTVHRYAYERFIGPVPKGINVCHKCDVRNCVNPSHLFLGTQKENIHDMIRKGRKVISSRLSFADAQEIRKAYSSGKQTQQEIADKYGVCRPQISLIITNKRWNPKQFGGNALWRP